MLRYPSHWCKSVILGHQNEEYHFVDFSPFVAGIANLFWYPGIGGFYADPNNFFFGGVLIFSSKLFPSLQSTKYSILMSRYLAFCSFSFTSLILNPSSLVFPPTSLNLVTLPKIISLRNYLHLNVFFWTEFFILGFFLDWLGDFWFFLRRWLLEFKIFWQVIGCVWCQLVPDGSTFAFDVIIFLFPFQPCWLNPWSSCQRWCLWLYWAVLQRLFFSWDDEFFARST